MYYLAIVEVGVEASGCELVVKFESIDDNPNELILVISAFREVKR